MNDHVAKVGGEKPEIAGAGTYTREAAGADFPGVSADGAVATEGAGCAIGAEANGLSLSDGAGGWLLPDQSLSQSSDGGCMNNKTTAPIAAKSTMPWKTE